MAESSPSITTKPDTTKPDAPQSDTVKFSSAELTSGQPQLLDHEPWDHTLQRSISSLVKFGHRLDLETKVMGMAIAISILPVLVVGITAYVIAYHPQIIAVLGLGGGAAIPGTSPNTIIYKPLGWFILWDAVGTAVVVGHVSAYWVQRTLKPVLDGMFVSQSISQGNLTARISVEGIGDLAPFGHSINQMADQIQTLLQERQHQTQQLQTMNDELERRVKQRTSQLLRVIHQLKQEIWERKQTERALQESQVKLIHSEKMSELGQMVAGIVHEINNPVNFIHGNLRYVQGHVQDILSVLEGYQCLYPEPAPELKAIAEDVDLEFLTQDLRKIVSSMQIGTNRILGIVGSLRTFSRMGQVELNPVDLHECIESTLLILKHRFKAHSGRSQILVVKQYNDNLPLVECQSGQINQVLMNILANAIDALDESGDLCSQKSEPPMIIISTQTVGADHVTIQLSDNGPGIPAAVQHRLFDPFFTTKPVGQGTGLGMSISRSIITENHGGQLKLVSPSGQGATFIIKLPIKQKNRRTG